MQRRLQRLVALEAQLLENCLYLLSFRLVPQTLSKETVAVEGHLLEVYNLSSSPLDQVSDRDEALFTCRDVLP